MRKQARLIRRGLSPYEIGPFTVGGGFGILSNASHSCIMTYIIYAFKKDLPYQLVAVLALGSARPSGPSLFPLPLVEPLSVLTLITRPSDAFFPIQQEGEASLTPHHRWRPYGRACLRTLQIEGPALSFYLLGGGGGREFGRLTLLL
jgi:hypothetical protein